MCCRSVKSESPLPAGAKQGCCKGCDKEKRASCKTVMLIVLVTLVAGSAMGYLAWQGNHFQNASDLSSEGSEITKLHLMAEGCKIGAVIFGVGTAWGVIVLLAKISCVVNSVMRCLCCCCQACCRANVMSKLPDLAARVVLP